MIYIYGFLLIMKDYYIKENVEQNEFDMHKYVYDLKLFHVPKIISYNKENKIMTMEKVDGMNVSDMYGENAQDVPDEIFEIIVNIIKTLKKHNIEYPDITGYNFIEDKNKYGKIWIIDFEHAIINQNITNQNINSICNYVKKWNPDFN